MIVNGGEVPWVNRMAIILHKSLFPEADPFEEGFKPTSKIVMIADMMKAVYDAGYVDCQKDHDYTRRMWEDGRSKL